MIGPELPPHLEKRSPRDDIPKDEASIGPQIPSGLVVHDESEDSPPQAPSIGPSLPSYLLKQSSSSQKQDEDDDDDGAPPLPPAMRTSGSSNSKQPMIPSASSSKPLASTSQRRVIGPSLPTYAPTYDPNIFLEEDDDDGDVGPKPLPAGMRHEESDAVKEFMAREERRRKELEEASKPKAAQRDEWMLVPPSSSDLLAKLDPTKLKKSRQFSRSTAAPASKDNSLWTETPAERQQRLADEVAGKKRRAAEPQLVDDDPDGTKKRRRMEEEKIRKGVEQHTKKLRGAALVDQHASSKKGEEDKGDVAIWDHSRDMGLGGRLMDDDKRNKMLKEAKGLGDRFGTGKSGGFL